jgi:hypothetical protein
MVTHLRWVCKHCGLVDSIPVQVGFRYVYQVLAEQVVHMHNLKVASLRKQCSGGPYAVNIAPRYDDAIRIATSTDLSVLMSIANTENRPDALTFFIFPIQ